MNNTTVERIEIKMRGNNVYDIYVNKKFIGNAGCYLVALERVKDFIEYELGMEQIVKEFENVTQS